MNFTGRKGGDEYTYTDLPTYVHIYILTSVVHYYSRRLWVVGSLNPFY